MAQYVDGLVVPVPKQSASAYRRVARKASHIGREHGAREYRECEGDDLSVSVGMPVPKAIRVRPGETVVFACTRHRSRAHPDRVNARLIQDSGIAGRCDGRRMPFDSRRMHYGGFATLVEA